MTRYISVTDPDYKSDRKPLEIADVFKRPLGRFKAMDVKGAGFKDLETFKEYWQDKYGVEWNPQETAHVILFKEFKQ